MHFRTLHIPLTKESKQIIMHHVLMNRVKNNVDKIKTLGK